MGKDITFNGSGELDNGWTVSVMHDLTDAAAWASSSITIGMGSLGTIIVDQGTGADFGSALDNVVPVAFEEADAGMDTGMRLSGGAITPNGSITYKLPVFSGLQLGGSYQPRSGGAANADGGTSGLSATGKVVGNLLLIGVQKWYLALESVMLMEHAKTVIKVIKIMTKKLCLLHMHMVHCLLATK